ncbi:lipopolysaccharide assembly protein LapB [Endothiovibrio diazotrophicus]
MMTELLWFLLPVAAASGWLVARWERKSREARNPLSRIPADYFKGLNYLLNEQPDKAIEVFIRVLEVDKDTIETHFTLGNLFRRRGEVDRAIHIHQNLIARPSLSGEQRAQALLALGEDYMKAGLFDRAENLFLELVELGVHAVPAQRYLVAIYQQERDWEKAIEMTRRLEKTLGQGQGATIAMYWCEQAETSRDNDEVGRAGELLVKALRADPNCARASLIEGELAMEAGEWRRARDAFQRIEGQAPAYLPLALDALEKCYWRLDESAAYRDYLRGVLERHPSVAVMLALAEQVRRERGEREAAGFIIEQLRHHPSVRGLDELIELHLTRSEGAARENLLTLKELTRRLLEDRPLSQCGHCGFTGKKMHWQCPSCKKWHTVKPIDEATGD